jgi:nitroreductase
MSGDNSFIETMLTRRCVRKYTGAPVSREDMVTIIRAGMSAPSSKDTRHRYFIAVDDPAMVRTLGDGLPFSKMVFTAKHIIIIASDLTKVHGGAEIDYWVQDCAVAGENILLAAHSLGIATCWTAAHPRVEREAFLKKTLGIPEHVRPLCVIAVGIGTGEEKPRDKFEPEKIFWNLWGNTSILHDQAVLNKG